MDDQLGEKPSVKFFGVENATSGGGRVGGIAGAYKENAKICANVQHVDSGHYFRAVGGGKVSSTV